MSEPKWTPGPWYATDVDYPDGAPHDHPQSMQGGEDGTWTVSCCPDCAGWCHDGGFPGYGVSEANARLMAAAPALYEALDNLVTRFERACRYAGSDAEFIAEATALHRAVLAKARGEAA